MTILKNQSKPTNHANTSAIALAWVVTLLVSSLGEIAWFELTGAVPIYLFWVKLSLLVILIVLCWYWKPISALRPFFVMLLVLTSLLRANSWFLGSSPWITWQNQKTFTVQALTAQSVEIVIALLLIGLLSLLRKKRHEFFLVRGDLKTNIGPMKLFGQKSPDPLWRFGLIFTLVVFIVQFFMFILPLSITFDTITHLLPLIPIVLLLAASNGFTEEIIFRAAPIVTVYEVVGKSNAVWMAAVMFGLAHYFGGIPSGLIGVLTTAFLGWFFGKCMIESRGFFWPWFFHFLQDILPFTLMSLAPIK